MSAKEVEDLIVAHPAVQAVAVVGKQHEFLDEVVVAFVIPVPGDHDEAAVTAEIVETCRQNLATFKVPRAVYFVDEFPTGTLDKILKNKLREMADEQTRGRVAASPLDSRTCTATVGGRAHSARRRSLNRRTGLWPRASTR